MKKTISICCLLIMSISFIYAQTDDNKIKNKTRFGVTIGYINATAKAKADGSSITSSNSVSGISLGINSNSRISEKFHIQPSVQFAIIEEESWLFVPVTLKYYIEDKFNLLAGPQGTLSLEDKQGLPINTFGLDFCIGAGYDISHNFYLEARYAIELTNRTPNGISYDLIDLNDPFFGSDKIDLKTRVNSFHFTLGYRFN